MTLYLRVRALGPMLVGVLVAVAGVAVPVAVLPITAGPMGATVALGLVLALIVPVAAAWACGRGAAEIEGVAVRNIAELDVALVLACVATTAGATAAIEVAGGSATGLLVSRATLTFAGLLLAAWSWRGWSTAAVPPTVYFIAVAVAGRGEDIAHPAPWALIAADGADGPAWVAGLAAFAAGLLLAARRIEASR